MARSRYHRTEILDGNHFATFRLDRSNAYRDDTFDGLRVFEHVAVAGDRLDHLAAKFLNDDKYWWAIALVNNLKNPFLEPGQKVRVPLDVQDVLDRI